MFVIFIRFPAKIAEVMTTAPIEKSIIPRERLGIIAMIMIAGRTDCLRITTMDLAVNMRPLVAIPKNRNTIAGNNAVFHARVRYSLVLDDI